MVSIDRFVVCIASALLLSHAPAANADEVSRDYRLGLGHYARGRWELAADAFARMVADHPRDEHALDARFYLAESLVQLKRYDAAGGHFRALRHSELCHHSARVLFRCAELAYLDGRLREADRLFREFTDRHAGHELNAVALCCLGAIALKHEDPFAALQAYGLALEMFPDPASDHERVLGVALALEQIGDMGGARRFYTGLAQRAGFGVADRAILRLGLDHLKRDEPAAAVALWADFDRRFPASTLRDRIRTARGDALRQLGRYSEAAREIDSVLRDKPRGPSTGSALLSRIRIAVAQEDIQAVDVHLSRFRKWLPDSPLLGGAEWTAAKFYVRQRQYRLAIEPLEAFVSQPVRDRQRQTALAQLVLCYARTGRLQPAEARLEMLADTCPSRELVQPIVLELADRSLAGTDIDRARRLYRDLVSGTAEPPLRAQALFGLASADLAADDRNAAIGTLRRLVEMGTDTPQQAEGALLMGRLLQDTGQTVEALSIYQQAVDSASEPQYRRRTLLCLARLHDSLGRPAQAADAYRRLLDLGGGTDEFDDALSGLAWVLKSQGDMSQSFRLFAQIHETCFDSPHWPEATYLLAERAFQSQDVDRASALLEALFSRTETERTIPTRIASRALYLKGQIAAHRRQWTVVLETMSVLLRDFDETALEQPARYLAAEARYRMGSTARAATLFRELQLDAQRAEETVWAARAGLRYVQILARRGQWTEALDNARLLVKEFPEFDHRYEVDYVIGRSLAAQGLLADARDAYQRVTASEQGRGTETAAMAQWMIGETYMHQKDYARARREFLAVELLYAYPNWQARALLEAGKCCELMNQWTAAQRHYSELVDRYPATGVAERASRRLRTALIRKDPR